MVKSRHLKAVAVFMALGALLLQSNLYAEVSAKKFSQANNVQWTIWTGSYYPPNATYTSRTQNMWPKGSGNVWAADNSLVVNLAVTFDMDGDGVPEDTVTNPNFRESHGVPANVWDKEYYRSIYESGKNVYNTLWADVINQQRVYTTLDADDVRDWPAAGRVGDDPNGEIIQAGDETMLAQTMTVWWATPAHCGSYTWRYHFLSFGENSDMVYINCKVTNATELLQFAPDEAPNALGQAHPDGMAWKDVRFCWYNGGFKWMPSGGSSTNIKWAWHPAKQTLALVCADPTVTGMKPAEPPLWGTKVLRSPSHNGEQTTLTQAHFVGGGEFGAGSKTAFQFTLSDPEVFRGMGAEEPRLTGGTNPWTGRATNGWPGVLTDGDTRYNQWLWSNGGRANQNQICYGTLHDMAPRDTASMDMVVMFCYPAHLPLQIPSNDIANIDAPYMQEALAPMVHLAEVAQAVHDGGFILPTQPSVPPLTIIPGDRQVTITWSNVNLEEIDPYYTFLHDNNLDPNNRYREKDFEGFRVWRNFTGPTNDHAELLKDCSISAGNLQFYYIDKLDDDNVLRRMRNGMKIWYALEPYDRNIDPATNEPFSLPDPGSGKIWNRTGQRLYNVIPRSDASNFKSAQIEGEVQYISGDGRTVEPMSRVVLKGPGDGSLTDPPLRLEPLEFKVSFFPVINERLTAAKTLYLTVKDRSVVDQGCPGLRQAITNSLALVDGGYETAALNLTQGSASQTLSFSGPVDNDGVNYAFKFTFEGMDKRGGPSGQGGDWTSGLYYHIGLGSYTGGEVSLPDDRSCGRPGTSPSNLTTTVSGRFQVTWKDAGNGALTVEVKDLTGNATVNKVDYPDEWGWGFQTKTGFGGPILDGGGQSPGVYYKEAFVQKLPKNQRTVKMEATLPADNTEQFGFFLNGLLWAVQRDWGDGISMPTAGTVWIIDNAYGSWNSNLTEFTQLSDMAYPGDKWEIKIKPTSLNPEDADLNKIRVVPNPYIASSLLDIGPQNRRIDFVNLPARCTIRIYTLSGNLVNVLNHIGANRQGWGDYKDWDRLTANEPRQLTGYDNHSGTEPWNLRNRFGHTVASGLYFFHVVDETGKQYTGKFYVVI